MKTLIKTEAEFKGVFHVWDNPGYSDDDLAEWMSSGRKIADLPFVDGYQRVNNILMATQKLLMANAVYPTITSLVITSQTTTPNDGETSYSGTIYTSVASDEFYRSGNGNPYRIGWNISASGANGTWGSFILVNGSGAMINRALAGVTKSAGQAKIIDFEGSVV